MKCEICHERDAEEAVHRVVDGVDKELYVCHQCAEAGKAGEKKAESADGEPSKGLPEAAQLITGLLKQMFDAGIETASIIDNPMTRPSGPPCPVCGMTAEDYHRSSRLGCAHCYEHFAAPLAHVIRDMQPGATHVGKMPAAFAGNARKEGK